MIGSWFSCDQKLFPFRTISSENNCLSDQASAWDFFIFQSLSRVFYVYLGLLKCLANAIRNIWDQPLRKSLGEDIHLTWKCERQLIICHRHWSCSLHHLHLHLARVGNHYGPGSSGFKMKKEEKLTVRSPPGSSVKVYKILEIVPKKWNELGIFYICFLFSYTKK